MYPMEISLGYMHPMNISMGYMHIVEIFVEYIYGPRDVQDRTRKIFNMLVKTRGMIWDDMHSISTM